MSKHLERDLNHLTDRLSALGTMVDESAAKAIAALQTFDPVLLEEIFQAEEEINQAEVELEEECLKILALHQPSGIDLRFLMVVIKVNNDLERMADQLVNIAERIKFLIDQERVVADLDFIKMGEISSAMVRMSIRALVDYDSRTAREILTMDDELDELHARTYRTLQEVMQERPTMVVPACSYLTVSSNLERLGDLATNIAEEVIFMVDGEVLRHRT